ncbi:hypothetical protein PODOV032v1_p0075 [Vibrio phage 219E41.1]|nr:hypothetical protein PODOV032v1_p0075 [Vibrio phage 219E41.1]
MKIYCCNCNQDVEARLTDGSEIHPHRSDLFDLPFWKHDKCGQFVGCHHKTSERTKPLGVIPSPEIKKKRQEIHRLIDSIWQCGRMRRGDLYKALSKGPGSVYHTAELRTAEDADWVIKKAKQIRKSLGMITI